MTGIHAGRESVMRTCGPAVCVWAVATTVCLALTACGAEDAVHADGREPVPSSSARFEARESFDARAAVTTVTEIVASDGLVSRGLVASGTELVEAVDTATGSAIRAVAPDDGRVRVHLDLPEGMRAGGITRVPAGLWQFTLDRRVAVLRDSLSLREVRRAEVGPGWGACFTGEVVVHSDGSNRLTTRDPGSLAELGSVRITGHWVAGQRLAGLACVHVGGHPEVWALVHGSDWAVRVDPVRGVVTAVASLARIRAEKPGLTGQIGGIATAGASDAFWVAGAFPFRFRVRLAVGP